MFVGVMVSDLREIKNRIYDEELIVDILEALECMSISEEQNGQLIIAQLPSEFQSKNKRAIQIKNNESLTSHIRNRGIKGDIFAIVGYILFDCQDFEDVKENLYEIKAWICNLFEWQEYMDDVIFGITSKPKKVEWNQWLKPYLSKKKERERFEYNLSRKNKPIDRSILTRYIMKPHKEFIESGIKCKTQKEFEIGFCTETQRVIYPIYDNNGKEIVGIKGRYVGENKLVADQKKYLYLIPCDKSILLYNLHRAISYIKEKNEVLVFESAKSCMLAFQYGFKNAVSLEGNEMSNVQAFLLMQLNVPITFCFDNDMEIDFIYKQVKLIRNRLCFAIIDQEHKLNEKDSPIDQGKKTWEYLYNSHKYKIDCYKAKIRKEKKSL
jgi:DNA primase